MRSDATGRRGLESQFTWDQAANPECTQEEVSSGQKLSEGVSIRPPACSPLSHVISGGSQCISYAVVVQQITAEPQLRSANTSQYLYFCVDQEWTWLTQSF